MNIVEDQKKIDIGYLVDFEKAINNNDAPSILRLWEEYTSSDEVDANDYQAILEAVKNSELREYIGRHVERGVPLWELIEESPVKDDILRLIIDIEMTENKELHTLTLNHLKTKFGEEKDFNNKMRLIGLRSKTGSFKGAISHYILLNHMQKGNFVFHTAGWGVGEIMDVSLLREQLGIEFDYVPGRKDISFKIAFNTLIPIPKTHFLSLRFGSPDQLEALAKKNPIEVVRMLLKDLGPLTAAEIKDELCELVIPEKEWNRWWQTARARIKKDTQIESPPELKSPFRILKNEVSHEQRFQKALETKPDADTLIQMVYSFLKDFSETLKNQTFKESLIVKLKELISFNEITSAQELQIHFFMQDLLGEKNYPPITELIKNSDSIDQLINEVPIQAFKKRALSDVRKHREDWETIFLQMLFAVNQNSLRDYIVSELLGTESEDKLTKKLIELCDTPQQYPELVIWYFQKIMSGTKYPLSDLEGKSRLFEALLILLSHLEQNLERRDLIKKVHSILSLGRFAVVRKIMKEASTSEVQEFLLLVTKCHSLDDHDIKTFYSLAEVAHPSLKIERKKEDLEKEDEIIWTTKKGYEIVQTRIQQIGTVETVDNAKEIEIARAHGDLRENAEFKAALERRDRLQSELTTLSDQLNKCRILTDQDIDTHSINIGTTIDFESQSGKKITYTLLGPWDADPDKNILSFQSKLAKNMIGLKKGDTLEIKDKKLTVSEIRSAI